MPRKNHRTARTLPAARSPRSAVHRRRNRAIRHLRPAAANAISLTPRSLRSFAPRWSPKWRDAGPLVLPALFAAGVAMALLGIALGPAASLASPDAPDVRAGQMFLPAMILAGVAIRYGNRNRWSVWLAKLNRHESSLIPLAALMTGMLVLGLPALFSAFNRLAGSLHVHFILSDPLLRIHHLGVMLVVCFLSASVFLELGRLMGDIGSGRSRAVVLAGWAAGLILGIGLTTLLRSTSALLLPAASLPFLLIALIAANSSLADKPAPAAA